MCNYLKNRVIEIWVIWKYMRNGGSALESYHTCRWSKCKCASVVWIYACRYGCHCAVYVSPGHTPKVESTNSGSLFWVVLSRDFIAQFEISWRNAAGPCFVWRAANGTVRVVGQSAAHPPASHRPRRYPCLFAVTCSLQRLLSHRLSSRLPPLLLLCAHVTSTPRPAPSSPKRSWHFLNCLSWHPLIAKCYCLTAALCDVSQKQFY